MDSMIQWLADQCKQKVLTEKWLLAEELRIAQQWKDRVNLLGCSTINLHSKTLATITISLVSNLLAKNQLTCAGRGQRSPDNRSQKSERPLPVRPHRRGQI